ncbi:AI-2E family transporter [Bacillus sp. AFS076308]|uniref:AI-2E family transporter n=1 Tax=unclassified Bacillus (in: firmicutes) TaxID=185979 RepID=UPI000BF2930B|nr:MULTISPECIES: AI-2E family transporter [unclassified Bacillus (in: firmicutes)]PFO02595.1 AI-2E family transporter [Bacillus sp. AFS076308]PGV55488.1 AI-2E family transporter [Bacillus sp. AFS037270]
MINKLMQSSGFKRISIFVLIALVLYAMRSMINLILLTFIFTFLMNRLVQFIEKKIPLNRRLIVVISYACIVGLLSYCFVMYLPMIIQEITALIKQLTAFYTAKHDNIILNYLVNRMEEIKISSYLEQGFTFLIKYFTDISSVTLQVLLALLLSIFCLLEKPRLIEFTKKFRNSKISSIYEEVEFFGRKFVGTFGKVIEAQLIIAVVNCILTTISLWLLDFPQLGGLSIMVFVLGLIPVAGVIISLIPLVIIAYSIGGLMKVLYVGIAIFIIHGIEAYILNPNLMSSKTNLPVFYTFIILIFSEHFFGVWGLIIGIPVFVFLLDVLEVTDHKKV